jgi:hypothetical protein|tara:strand:+ start:6922 stop:7095 length:174 start_codon:yes stop_codon:yes gene_type:complete
MKNNKEFLTDKEEDNKYRQGRTRKQYKSSVVGSQITIGGFIMFIILIIMYRLLINLF